MTTKRTRPQPACLAVVAVTLMLSAGSGRSALHGVTANPDMTFTPSDITIHQGDTIAFENAGGLHNVNADDNSFICAINCTTNNGPSAEPWRATVRFTRPGTLGYFCEAHGNLDGGMRGSITVLERVFGDGFESP